eukprot:6458265-Amphidinium_carterae.1
MSDPQYVTYVYINAHTYVSLIFCTQTLTLKALLKRLWKHANSYQDGSTPTLAPKHKIGWFNLVSKAQRGKQSRTPVIPEAPLACRQIALQP